jgi:hypothetical protein
MIRSLRTALVTFGGRLCTSRSLLSLAPISIAPPSSCTAVTTTSRTTPAALLSAQPAGPIHPVRLGATPHWSSARPVKIPVGTTGNCQPPGRYQRPQTPPPLRLIPPSRTTRGAAPGPGRSSLATPSVTSHRLSGICIAVSSAAAAVASPEPANPGTRGRGTRLRPQQPRSSPRWRPARQRRAARTGTGMIPLILAAVSCTLLGFAIGYFGFKIRTRWCPEHGVRLRCPECPAPAPPPRPAAS